MASESSLLLLFINARIRKLTSSLKSTSSKPLSVGWTLTIDARLCFGKYQFFFLWISCCVFGMPHRTQIATIHFSLVPLCAALNRHIECLIFSASVGV